MLRIIKAYDIPDTIVQAINVMYSSTQAVVLSPAGETNAFEILAGVTPRRHPGLLASTDTT